LVLVSCGGGTTKSAVPTTESTTTTVAIDFKQQYLDFVAPSNAMGDKVNKMISENVPLEDLFAAFEESAKVERTFGNGLLRAQWPDNSRQAIQELAETVLESASVLDNVRNMSPTAFNSQLSPIHARSAAKASVVRALLGLDPPPDLTPSTTTTTVAA